MPVRNVTMSCTGCSGLKQISLSESYEQPSAFAEVVCTGTTLAIGDSATVVMGYSDESATMLTGTVKSIQQARPDQSYTVTVYDEMVKAVDYFMAADDPESPFTRENIAAETLVQDLLAQAGLTSVSLDSPGFTFGVTGPFKLNLQSVWDLVGFIAGVVGFHIYAQTDGTIRFLYRPPFPVGGDSSERTFETGNNKDLKLIRYNRSTENLRNRVVVYGKNPIQAVALAVSPYLPASFYQSAVIAHEMIDTQQAADDTAADNLTLLNRLTENLYITALGKPSIRVRDIVAVSESFTGLGAGTLWFVYSAMHRISRDGYSMELTLTR